MKDTVFLVLDSGGARRMTKRWPELARDEIGVKVTLNVPDSAFRSPVVAATLAVPEDNVIQPVIEMTVDALPAEETQ